MPIQQGNEYPEGTTMDENPKDFDKLANMKSSIAAQGEALKKTSAKQYKLAERVTRTEEILVGHGKRHLKTKGDIRDCKEDMVSTRRDLELLLATNRRLIPDAYAFPWRYPASAEVKTLYKHLDTVERRLLKSLRKNIDYLPQLIYDFRFATSYELLSRQVRFVQEMKLQLLREPQAKLKLPDFMVIGTPRAASTWSKKILSGAEGILFASGEPRAFSKFFLHDAGGYLSCITQGSDMFQKMYKHVGMNTADVVQGEKNPDYLGLPERQISFIKALIPNLKTVLLVRDPVDACWSNIQFELSSKDYDLRTLNSGDSFVRSKVMKRMSMYDFWNYTSGIASWNKHFPALRIVHFEDIIEHPARCGAELLTFLGVSGNDFDAGTPFEKKINQNTVNMPIPDFVFQALREKFALEYDNWEALFGRKPKY
jgi:hypothetical protein